MLRLFSIISKKKEEFVPFEKTRVKIFICGPTLYDYTHLGHARIFLVYDLLCRFLKSQGLTSDVLVNMTDINQNVFAKALDQKLDYHKLTRYYSSEFVKDLNLLNIKTIARLVHVSDYVSDIVKHISFLVENKNAYLANDNIYFDTKSISSYGKISEQSKEQLNLHRLDIAPNKKNSIDFMLWNCSEDFGFSWSGKFGKGIPWWHIQDTTVAFENFGKHYDIHGGARELVYPHHEAHLAQYQALTNTENPVKFWVYIGLVLVKAEKMSKSLGNIVIVRDLVAKYGQNLIRLYLFSFKYQDDIEYEEKVLITKKDLLNKIYDTRNKVSNTTSLGISNLLEKFFKSLEDDLNSPHALHIFENICDLISKDETISPSDFQRITNVLGLSL